MCTALLTRLELSQIFPSSVPPVSFYYKKIGSVRLTKGRFNLRIDSWCLFLLPWRLSWRLWTLSVSR